MNRYSYFLMVLITNLSYQAIAMEGSKNSSEKSNGFSQLSLSPTCAMVHSTSSISTPINMNGSLDFKGGIKSNLNFEESKISHQSEPLANIALQKLVRKNEINGKVMGKVIETFYEDSKKSNDALAALAVGQMEAMSKGQHFTQEQMQETLDLFTTAKKEQDERFEKAKKQLE